MRYVCSLCHGKGTVSTIEHEPEVKADDPDRAEPEYKFVDVKCPVCAEKGRPPFIEV